MWSLWRKGIAADRDRGTSVDWPLLRKQFLIEEHLSKGEPTDAAAGLKQKIAPRPKSFHFDYLVYKNSLRLRMTFVKSTSEPDKIMSVANESSLSVGGRVSAIR